MPALMFDFRSASVNDAVKTCVVFAACSPLAGPNPKNCGGKSTAKLDRDSAALSPPSRSFSSTHAPEAPGRPGLGLRFAETCAPLHRRGPTLPIEGQGYPSIP